MEETAFPMAIFGRVVLLFSNKTEEIRKKTLSYGNPPFSCGPEVQDEDISRTLNDFHVKKAFLCTISQRKH